MKVGLKDANEAAALAGTGVDYAKGVVHLIDGKPEQAAHDFIEGAVNLVPFSDEADELVKGAYRVAGKDPATAPTVADAVNSGVKKVGEFLGQGLYNLTHEDVAARDNEWARKHNEEAERKAAARPHAPETPKPGAPGEPIVTPGEPIPPGTQAPITLDPVVITAPSAFERQQAKVAAMDPHAVIVDGVVRPPSQAVNLEGTVQHVGHNDKTGLTTIDFADKMGHHRAISFKEPMGHDEAGNPTHHPLQEMADKLEAHDKDYDKMKVAIDGKGNTDYSVGNAIVRDSGHDGPGQPRDLSPAPKREAMAVGF
jgi:hypothetical protein